MLLGLSWVFFLLLFSLSSLLAADLEQFNGEFHCGRQTYGSPDIVDCHPLLETFANHQDNVLRVFDEEQLRADFKGSWPGLIGIVGAAHLNQAIQVPRSYTLNSCNFALLSYTSHDSVDALGGTSWAKINAGGNFMMTKCLLNGPLGSGGVVVIPSTQQPRQSVLSLFMWQSGSLFDAVWNSYSNQPAGMIPAPGDGLAGNLSAVNTTGVPPTMLGIFQTAVGVNGNVS